MAKRSTVAVQVGALPYRIDTDAHLDVLLVTTRETRRWIIPKGWPIRGLTPAQSAAREAFEEAGIEGIIADKPAGRFTYTKRREARGDQLLCEVRVFPLKVCRQLESWPEAAERETRWTSLAEAIDLLQEEGLRQLIADFGRQVDAAAWDGKRRAPELIG